MCEDNGGENDGTAEIFHGREIGAEDDCGGKRTEYRLQREQDGGGRRVDAPLSNNLQGVCNTARADAEIDNGQGVRKKCGNVYTTLEDKGNYRIDHACRGELNKRHACAVGFRRKHGNGDNLYGKKQCRADNQKVGRLDGKTAANINTKEVKSDGRNGDAEIDIKRRPLFEDECVYRHDDDIESGDKRRLAAVRAPVYTHLLKGTCEGEKHARQNTARDLKSVKTHPV